jgi:hypothetical protein
MTTRRWMAAVVLAAVLVRVAQEVERYCRLKSRYAAALRDYRSVIHWHDEGRLDLVKSVLASERLLEAELALSSQQKNQASAITAHLERAGRLVEAETNEPWMCNDNRNMWIGDAEFTLANWRARLKSMRGPR